MDTKTCPQCGETINHYATKCRNCGVSLLEDEIQDAEDVVIRSRKETVSDQMQLTTSEEQKEIEKALQAEEQRRLEKQRKKDQLRSSWSFVFIDKSAKLMDKYFLDVLIGTVFPVVGDLIPTFFVIPYIYVSMFKIRSLPLTLAVVFNTMVDWALGLLPVGVGIVGDAFHRSFIKNRKLILGFVEDDREIIKEVNRKAVLFSVLIFIMIFVIWGLVTLALSVVTDVFQWISGLFA